MLKTIILVLMCIIPSINVLACSGGFKKGYGYSLNELVNKTDSIVVASFLEYQDKGSEFKIIQTLKAPNMKSIDEKLNSFYRLIFKSHQRFKYNHQSIDFNRHQSEEFWLNKNITQEKIVSRVQWYSGMCMPAFTFKNNEKYLLFLDSPGSFHAAEILKKEDDEWYQYVIKRTFNLSKMIDK